MIKTNQYSVSLTAGALLFEETEAIFNSFENFMDFYNVSVISNENKLPTNSESSRKRIATELRKRFKSVKSPELWDYYQSSSSEERKILLFYIICISYPIVLDFMTEVVVNKWLNIDKELDKADVMNFIHRKFDSHPELEEYSDSSLKKVATRIIRIMEETGLLINGILKKIESDSRIWKLFVELEEIWFLEIMFLSENERQYILNNN